MEPFRRTTLSETGMLIEHTRASRSRPIRVRRRYIAPPLTPPQVLLGYIPKGYPGTLRTVSHIAVLIREGSKDFYVRQKAIDILLGKRVKPKHYIGEIKALFQWVQRNVRYTKDPFRLEVLHSARRLLELRAGDCDDMAILLGAMLEAIGHPVRLALTGPDPLRPRLFTHIYIEANHKGRWISLDPTMPHPMGWAPRTFVRKVIGLKG
jgi:transglutaminase-like putative cysteine protease